jgi:hypothetical protein
VPDGRQEDVAARFIRLRFNGEPQRVLLVKDVLAEQVERFAIAFERGPHVLGAVVFAALPAAPHDERLCTEFGGEINVAQRLAQREPPDTSIITGECAVFEDRMGEQVGGDHGHDHPVRLQSGRQPTDGASAFVVGTAEWKQVVVVEGQAIRAEFGESLHRLNRVQSRPGRHAERIVRDPAYGPQAEGELVGRLRREITGRDAGLEDGHRSAPERGFVLAPNIKCVLSHCQGEDL